MFLKNHRRAAAALSLSLILAALVPACRTSPPPAALQRFEFTSEHMGTLFTITLYAPSHALVSSAAEAAFERVAALDQIMSDYKADSELMLLCDKPAGKPVPVSRDLFNVLSRAQIISQKSNGAFDVTIGPCVRLWRLSRKRKVLPTASELAAARELVGFKNLRLDRTARTATLMKAGMRLDVGGIAKGFAADEAMKVLKARGLDRALVAASGDIAVGAPPPGESGWKVGVAAIDDKGGRITKLLVLHDCGVSTSGDTEQFIEIGGVRYSHILDPATGLGLTNRIQATIVAPDATATDGLATTVCVLGPQRGMALIESLPRTAAYILIKDGQTDRTFISKRFKQIKCS